MNTLARSLVLLAIAGHIGLAVVDANARGGGGGGGGGGHGSAGFGGGFGGASFARAPPPPPPPPNPGKGGVAPPRQHHYGGFNEPDDSRAPPPGECAGGLQLNEVDAYVDPIDGLTKISGETQRYIERCGCNAQICIADALDRYAEALTQIAPRLPPALHELPRIVAAAAHQARSAPTKHVAVRVLRSAVAMIHAVVHKTIALMRAADPDSASVATRGGDLVARTLSVAATALERADSL